MALIKCKECGKKISSEADNCPNCGYPVDKSIKKDDTNNKKSNKRKIIMSIMIGIILLIIGGSIFFYLKANELSPSEIYAVGCTERLKNRMKSPDSFKLQDNVVIIVDKNSNKYTFIDYTAENSYGASIRNVAIFSGYTYLGNYDDKDEDNFDDSSQYLDFLWARVVLTQWKLEGDNSKEVTSSEIIEAKRIGKKLKIQYNE